MTQANPDAELMAIESERNIWKAIRLERRRQDGFVRDGRFPFNCATEGVPCAVKLSILVEEVGEVAREICEAQAGYIRYDHLRTELIQVAAVAVAWLESMQTKPEVTNEP